MQVLVVFIAIFAAILHFGETMPRQSENSLLLPNSPENIQKLRLPNTKENAEELSGQFEGDIVLNADQLAALLSKTGLLNTSFRWPDKIIPYELNEDDFDDEQMQYIRLGLDTIENSTCLKFIPRTAKDKNFISVTGTETGCWSMVGYQSGKQELNLQLFDPGNGCFRLGTIMHEFIHAIGFYHMQSAFERDEYVKIIWENIQSGKERNFNKRNEAEVTNFGVSYDYSSVMHYGPFAFSSNGEKTIIAIDPNAKIGQRNQMSEKDIKRINLMYNCTN